METVILKEGDSKLTFYPDAPQWSQRSCAAIGAFHFEDKATALTLLSRAKDLAATETVHAILAPMEGDTWHSYRLWLESDASPAFLMEPVSSPLALEVLLASDFKVVSRYASSRARLQDTIHNSPINLDDITITNWDGEDRDRLIDEIFDLSNARFAKNEFFKPIERKSFHQMYQTVLQSLDRRFIFLAHDEAGSLCGFLFGYPDILNKDMKTVILKTYASRIRGVGHALADRFHRQALALGFETVIHALMHETNTSFQRSKQHNAHVFRRYGLLAYELK